MAPPRNYGNSIERVGMASDGKSRAQQPSRRPLLPPRNGAAPHAKLLADFAGHRREAIDLDVDLARRAERAPFMAIRPIDD